MMIRDLNRIVVIGAGMAGLSCATALRGAGAEVLLLDKGRGPGGRMSTRRMDTPLGEMSFDHGAQYFTARDERFLALVKDMAAADVVQPWPAAGPDAWVGTPGMNAVIRTMAAAHDVHWSSRVDRIERRNDGWTVHGTAQSALPFDAVVLAIPAEQALPFLSLHDFAMARQAMLARSQPCWTGMYAFDQPLPGAAEVLRDVGNLGWAARNLAKPGRSGAEGWVVQARPEWSRQHLERDAADIAALLLRELAEALGTGPLHPAAAAAHRWRYAMCAGLGLGALWNGASGLGVCGDWLLGPRVECAWLSGLQLAERMTGRGDG